MTLARACTCPYNFLERSLALVLVHNILLSARSHSSPTFFWTLARARARAYIFPSRSLAFALVHIYFCALARARARGIIEFQMKMILKVSKC